MRSVEGGTGKSACATGTMDRITGIHAVREALEAGRAFDRIVIAKGRQDTRAEEIVQMARAMATIEAHAVMTRYGARDVIRLLARLVLEGGPCTTERFKEIVTALKEKLDLRGREVLHPLRLALVGRAGEGQLDRVILLVDAAANAGFAANIKTVRERIIEFCSALD